MRSAFAHPDVGNDLFNLGSPKYPSSVSKSRGKDYKNRDWKINCRQISFNKDHPVNGLGDKNSITNTVSSQECELNHDHKSGTSSSITSVVLDSERSVALNSLSSSTSGASTSTVTTVSMQPDLERRVALNSQSASTSGASISTITTLSMKPDSKILEVSKEAFGHTGGLLNALRTNLRKSRAIGAIRPASRVQISDDRESNRRQSSAGKSSMGSSSTGYDTKGEGFAAVPKTDRCKQLKVEMNVNKGSKGQGFSNPKFEIKKKAADLKLNKDRNLNFTDLRKSTKPVHGRVIAKKMTETSVFTRNTFSSKIKGKDTAEASRSQAALKSKVLLQTTHTNSLNLSRTGAQGVKGKVGSNPFSKGASSGKENTRGRVVLSHRSGGKDESVVRVSDHEVPKFKSKTKVGVTSNDHKFNSKPKVGVTSIDHKVSKFKSKPEVGVTSIDHKVPKFKSKPEVGVTSIGSKARIGRMNDIIMSLDTRVHLR
ncbi:uncharacterized protein [Spinacia oleracea]|nr:uncharacterized protein LOC110775694 isoform X3 [Spinacia oleracea]